MSGGDSDISITRRGLMLVLSSPSGAGKTTISRRLLDEDPNLVLSISATTRPKRPAEVEGKDYLFVTAEHFGEMVEAGAFLEHATVFGNAYGTPRAPVDAHLGAGRDVLFDIDWQGTQQVAEKALNDLVRVFILPPSTEELERRLEEPGPGQRRGGARPHGQGGGRDEPLRGIRLHRGQPGRRCLGRPGAEDPRRRALAPAPPDRPARLRRRPAKSRANPRDPRASPGRAGRRRRCRVPRPGRSRGCPPRRAGPLPARRRGASGSAAASCGAGRRQRR